MHLLGSVIVALLVPSVIMSVGAIAKKLASKVPWEDGHFFFGIELCVAGLADEASHLGELLLRCGEQLWHHQPSDTKLLAWSLIVAIYFGINAFILLLVMGIHQDWEEFKVDNKATKDLRFRKLVLEANGFGFFVLAIFVLLAQYVPAA